MPRPRKNQENEPVSPKFLHDQHLKEVEKKVQEHHKVNEEYYAEINGRLLLKVKKETGTYTKYDFGKIKGNAYLQKLYDEKVKGK